MANIFIIDDSESIIETLQFFLEENGHKVETFTNAKAALLEYKQNKPDILFVDIFMPYISGFEFIKRLRSIDTDTYIIAMSGGASPFNPESSLFVAEKEGANLGISKPLDFDKIIQIIENLKIPERN